ncbi:MAG: hypothetical protein KDD43_10990, partial [Bdellovibrionales bacterium]|nr:hypothetical protein [Bdellovibrionales bacterium]
MVRALFGIILFLSCISFPQKAKGLVEPVVGPQHLAVVLIDFHGDPDRPTPQEVEEAIFHAPYSINGFIRESSYGLTHLVGRALGWYDFPDEEKCELGEDELFEFLADKFRFSDYDRFLVLYHNQPEKCRFLGHSTFGREVYQTPQGRIEVSLSVAAFANRFVRPTLPYQGLTGITSSVIAHELGHGFGIRGHGNLFDCGSQALAAGSKGCKQEGIADMFQIMGGEGYYKPTLHHAACHKEFLGWMVGRMEVVHSDQIQPGEERRYVLAPYEEGRGIVALKIPLAVPIPIVNQVRISTLYVENRTAFGFNHRLTELKSNLAKHYNKISSTNSKEVPSVDPSGVQVRG